MCMKMSCSELTNCYSVSSTNAVTGAYCGAGNKYCVCNGTSCLAADCGTDSTYCAATFGPNSKCVNGICTSNACDSSSECKIGMTCRNKTCYASKCDYNTGEGCSSGTKCYKGYCINDGGGPNTTELVIVIIILFILCIVGIVVCYFLWRYKKKIELQKR
jgi:hypothetical protein